MLRTGRPTPRPPDGSRTSSGPGLALLFLTGTFAAIDWIMSLEPEWYSTIFGAMIITGQGLSALALMIIVASRLAGFSPLTRGWPSPTRSTRSGT